MTITRYSGKLTVGVSNLAFILKPSSHSNAKNHQDPVNIWNIYLTQELLRRMNYFDSGETA